MPAPLQAQSGNNHPLQQHLDRLVPVMLEQYVVNGVSVGVIENGEIAFFSHYGLAHAGKGTTPDSSTVYNVGSISKPVTALGVMHLVKEGLIELDDPVNRYLKGWSLTSDTLDAGEVTVRRLLSHTAGLSMPAVPEYDPGKELSGLQAFLADTDDGPFFMQRPGSGWSYSGGGYMILQKMIEDVTGMPFHVFMRERIMQPLGMTDSGYRWTPRLKEEAAQPYDSSRATDYFTYLGEAAASLNSTTRDLSRLTEKLIALAGGEPAAPGVVDPTHFLEMIRPAPDVTRPYGLQYGLGFELWPMGGDRYLTGHNGQNTGWTSGLWFLPESRDGLVVMTNDSYGYNTWKWIFCDWLYFTSEIRWPGICTGRPDFLPAMELYRGDRSPEEPQEESGTTIAAYADSLLAAQFPGGEPGASVLIARGDSILLQETYGMAELESGRPIATDTRFYLASLSKPFTAQAVLKLAQEELLSLDDPLGHHLTGLPEYRSRVTLRHLLTHSSGIPDYYQYLDWSRFRGLDNRAVLDTLANKPELDFEPGSQFAYSNSNYVLLALVVERVSGQTLGNYLVDEIFDPLGMEDSFAYEAINLEIDHRAYGYTKTDEGYRPMDYIAVRLGDGGLAPTGFTTTGGGGLYANTGDLHTWVMATFGGKVLGERWTDASMSPQITVKGNQGYPTETEAYGYGWFTGTFNDRTWVWHGGNFVGFSTFLLVEPESQRTIVILSNQAQTDSRERAFKLMKRWN